MCGGLLLDEEESGIEEDGGLGVDLARWIVSLQKAHPTTSREIRAK